MVWSKNYRSYRPSYTRRRSNSKALYGILNPRKKKAPSSFWRKARAAAPPRPSSKSRRKKTIRTRIPKPRGVSRPTYFG